MKRLFTSESVTEGHPDKVADRVSDSILDAYLAGDKNSRVACETFAGNGFIVVAGEISSQATVDVQTVARKAICETGYDRPEFCFDGNTCAVLVALDKQSPDIAMGVNKSYEAQNGNIDPYDTQGAGDQGLMFGYATNETVEYMPLALSLSHRLAKRLADTRKKGVVDYLRPDGKSQVTIEYENDVPVHIDTVVLSTQHSDNVSIEKLRKEMTEIVIKEELNNYAWTGKNLFDGNTKIYINPTGRFVLGGPAADTGLTGRKIIVDTYGGTCAHGGGAFSGKDPSKVDRSAAYYARYAAKNAVANGLATKLEIQVAYAIGIAKPVSVSVNSFGTGKYNDQKLAEIIQKHFDFRPLAIINELGLNRPVYTQTSSYGHFGNPDFSWEKLNKKF